MEHKGLRFFSKVTCFSTLLLIFVGGMVTSTDSGLSVPDWPLSYGTWFPPMIGGVFYEHGHRMAASLVGTLILILSVWLALKEKRKWLKVLGFAALGSVICQGILGGITVLFYLPTPVSVGHAVLAQTLFILTVIIAYSLSQERQDRQSKKEDSSQRFLQVVFVLIICVYIQLLIGAIMRHTGSGMAIPDFPTMGGEWFPRLDEKMLNFVNHWRFDNNLEPVNMNQIVIHLFHRLGALVVLLMVCLVNFAAFKERKSSGKVIRTIYFLDLLIVLQISLGILTVLTGKAPVVTSIHVATGAATLGFSVLLFLRAAPLSIKNIKLV